MGRSVSIRKGVLECVGGEPTQLPQADLLEGFGSLSGLPQALFLAAQCQPQCSLASYLQSYTAYSMWLRLAVP